ncbi:MAG: hypothetical protein JWN66_4935 [Sphingomonas bacterium]|uniref:hypothetical protein n=1 Tax=Sphingomonas bacterium TaxID=1895847 RepID=UPI002634163B|nr:hypothetical protein [Sphingomonas bacterium]MDB5707819.1 hypothetical protein [Sphingomonas bacterium]
MNCNLAGLARNAADCISPRKDRGAYAFMLQELAGHVDQVRAGAVSLDEFADYYKLRPVSPPSDQVRG